MQTYGMISQKGGSGKTTLALHLAAEASMRGRRTLLLDLDPQASAATWSDRRSQPATVTVRTEHASRLPAALELAEREGFEVAVIDTAPNADRAAVVAAKHASLVLVPCRPAILDLDAIEATLDCCRLALRPALVVLNAAPVRSRAVEEARQAVTQRGGVLANLVIHARVAFQHALVDGRVAAEYEPGGAAAAEIRALYDMLSYHQAVTPSPHRDSRRAA